MSWYLPSTVIADGGYAYAYGDGMGSTSCVASNALCMAGETAVVDPTGRVYGAGLGINLNQAMATGSASPPVNIYPVPTSATGIIYTLSALPYQGAHLIIDDNGTDYCSTLVASTGTVAWSKFNTKCWDNSGNPLTGPPPATHVELQVNAVATAMPFDLCVIAIAFAP
jgi:hypothetical protein